MRSAGRVLLVRPHFLAGGLCVGIVAANAARASAVAVAGLACACAVASAFVDHPALRACVFAAALALAAWWWGSVRLDALDRSVLLPHVGRAERALVVVTAPPRRSRYQLRIGARMIRFGRVELGEQVLLELPLGRAPPQGAVLEVLGQIELPR